MRVRTGAAAVGLLLLFGATACPSTAEERFQHSVYGLRIKSRCDAQVFVAPVRSDEPTAIPRWHELRARESVLMSGRVLSRDEGVEGMALVVAPSIDWDAEVPWLAPEYRWIMLKGPQETDRKASDEVEAVEVTQEDCDFVRDDTRT